MLDDIFGWLTLKTGLVGLVTGLAVYWIIKKWKYKLPPGPYGLPLVGNMHQFPDDMIHKHIYQWSLMYGPVVSVYFGPYFCVVVNNIETAMEVLVKKGAEFANRMRLPSTDAFTDGGKDIALGQYGPIWKLHRKIASKALRTLMMGQALEQRVHEAVSTVFEEIGKQTEPTDPENYVNFIVGNILCGLCFGGKYDYNDPELMEIIRLEDQLFEVFSGYGPLEDMVPGIGYVWESEKMRTLKNVSDMMDKKFLGKKFREHVESFDKGNIRDFTDTLILARREAEEDPDETNLERLSDVYLYQTISDIFFAGIDTSRLTLRWALLHMVAYPNIQKKVQEEIDKVVGLDDLPRLSHRPQLSYTEAVLHESMRLSSVAPLGVPHQSMCDTSVGGYDVPKNTMVMVNHWALHNDPTKWENVNDFIPERFLDSDGKLGPKPENWLPFSAGRRVCLGESVAKPELHLVFAALMQKFTWRLPDGVEADLEEIGNTFGLIPKQHKMIIEPRKPCATRSYM